MTKYVRIGRTGKPHGIKGEIMLNLDEGSWQMEDRDFLFIVIDGLPVPFFIEEYRITGTDGIIVKFEDTDTPEQAATIAGKEVMAEQEDEQDDLLEWDDALGFSLIDAFIGRKIGNIESVDERTENIVLKTDTGILVPAADELIESFDTKKREIRIIIPDGLLELNSENKEEEWDE